MAEGAVVAEGEGMAEDGVYVLSPRVVAPRAPSVFALEHAWGPKRWLWISRAS